MLSVPKSKLKLISQYDSMIVEEFDRAFPGLKVPAPVGGEVGLDEFDLSNPPPLEKRRIRF